MTGTKRCMGNPVLNPTRIFQNSSEALKLCGSVVMVMEVVMVMVMYCGKRRSGEHHDQEHSSKQLFHALNVAQPEM